MSGRKLVMSSVGVTIVMVIGYFLSFGKEVVIANYYGISNNVDAYTIALQVPVTLFAFVSVAIRSVVIPLYSELLYKKGQSDASRFVCQLISILSLLILCLIVLCEVFASGLIYLFAPGFNTETHNLAVLLLRLLLPCAVFTPIGQILTAVLNVHKQYVWASFAVLMLNMSIIFFIVFLHASWGIQSACLGNIVGCFLEVSFLVILVRKYFLFQPNFHWRDTYLSKALKMTFPVLWSMSIAEINAMVNKMVASFMFVGSIAALGYASKINSIMMQFFVSAIATIIYPLYAESSAKGNLKQLNRNVNIVMSIYVMLLLPLMFGIFTLKKEIIEIAFMRGVFDNHAVEVTQELLGFYTIGLLFMALRETITKVFYSLGDTKTPAKNATVGLCLNIILNLTLPFVLGVNGLALATAITAIFISTRLLYILKQYNKEIDLIYFFRNLKLTFISSCIMMAVILPIQLFTSFKTWSMLAIISITGAAVYLISISLLNVPIACYLKDNYLKKC